MLPANRQFFKFLFLSITACFFLTANVAKADHKDHLAQLTDFDGDGISDLSLFDKVHARFTILGSKRNSFQHIHLGKAGDIPASGDYDGDGVTEPTVFNPSTAIWSIYHGLNSEDIEEVSFGEPGQKPVPGNYYGDDCTSLATFDPRNSEWNIKSCETLRDESFILGDKNKIPVPVPADYDCDGKTDAAVFHRVGSSWVIKKSSNGEEVELQFGLAGDLPVPGDFDADTCAEPAVYRPTNNTYFHHVGGIDSSKNAAPGVTQWGLRTDLPYLGNTDGIRGNEFIVYRPSNNTFYIKSIYSGQKEVSFSRRGSSTRSANETALTGDEEFELEYSSITGQSRVSTRNGNVSGLGSFAPNDIPGFLGAFCNANIRLPNITAVISLLDGLTVVLDNLFRAVLDFRSLYLDVQAGISVCGRVDLPNLSEILPDEFQLNNCIDINLPNIDACVSASLPNVCLNDFLPMFDMCMNFELPQIEACMNIDLPSFDVPLPQNFEVCVGDQIDLLARLPIPNVDLSVIGDLRALIGELRVLLDLPEIFAYLNAYCDFRISAPQVNLGIMSGSSGPGTGPGVRSLPGDFNRDGRSDIVTVNESPNRARTGSYNWTVHTGPGQQSTISFGRPGDILIPGDYDGSGVTDPTVIREENGFAYWHTVDASGEEKVVQWGLAGDHFARGDVDCDGKDDKIAVHAQNGLLAWDILQTSTTSIPSLHYGLPGDAVFVADVTGDSCDEIIVAREIAGAIYWFHKDVVTGEESDPITWGLAGDTLIAPADYNADGRDDFIVSRVVGGGYSFYIRASEQEQHAIPFGLAGDVGLVGSFSGAGFNELAVYRPYEDKLYVRNFDGSLSTQQFPAGQQQVLTPDGRVVRIR